MLHTALDHQVEDGLMRLEEYNRMRLIVGKLWELKLQLHLGQDVLSLMLDLYLEDVIPKSLLVCMEDVIVFVCVVAEITYRTRSMYYCTADSLKKYEDGTI